MAEIGIHVQHQVIAVLEGVFHPSDDRGPQAKFSLSVQAVQAGFGFCSLVAPRAGAVGGIVVDNQDVHLRGDFPNGIDEQRQILDFVVGRNRDERALGADFGIGGARRHG